MNSRARSFCFIVIAAGIFPATNHTGAPAAFAAYPHTNQMAESAEDAAAQARPKGESLLETAALFAPSSKGITEPTQLSEYGVYAGESESEPSLSSLGTDATRSAMGGGVNWDDDFESYPDGNCMHGEGGWEGWEGDPAWDACLQEGESHSPNSAVDIVGDADLVRVYSDYTSGVWNYCTWQFIPNNFSGMSYFILLNTYPAPFNWSTQITFNSVTGMVESQYEGAVLPMILGQWVELCVEIDLVGDTQTITYGGVLLSTKSWSDGVSGGGAVNIGAVDLYADGASSIYYDDFTLIEKEGPHCGDGNCDPGENECGCPADCPGVCPCTIFTNQAEFEAFNEEEGKILKGIEDFEEGTLPPASVDGLDDPLCGGIPSTPPGTPYPEGLLQLNVCVQANIGGADSSQPGAHTPNAFEPGLAAASAGFLGIVSDVLLANYFVDSWDLMLISPPVTPGEEDDHTGVGFNTVSAGLDGAPPPVTVEISVYDKNNVLLVETTSPVDTVGSNFWGVWCAEPIGRINVYDIASSDGLQTGAEGADNIQLWSSCGEPEFCGNGLCCGPVGEDCTSCPQDCGACPICGDGNVDPGEDCDPPGSLCPNGEFCEADCTCPGLPNDDCIDSIPIFDGDTPFDTTGASTDGLPHAACQSDGQTYHDIWYRYLATCTGQLTVSTCDQADYDTDLVVYDGCFDMIPCPPGDEFVLGCNDDGPGCTEYSSELTVPVSEANCYTIRIGGWQDGDQGTAIVTLTCAECGNEICEDGEDACSCPADCPGECPCVLFDNLPWFVAFNLGHWNLPKGIEDFEESILPPGAVDVLDDPLCGGVPNSPDSFPYPNGLDQLNMCVQSNFQHAPAAPNPRGLNGLRAASAGYLGAVSDIVLANYFVDSMDLMFTSPPAEVEDDHTGIGFNPLTLLGGALVDIQVYDKSNQLLVSASSPADAAGSFFWGVWCTDPIGRINIHDPGGGAEGGDNIRLWLEQTGCQSDDECDDGDPCTNDTCVDGVCVHTPVDCSGAGEPCEITSCDPEGPSGNCNILMQAKNGTPCDDGSACTAEGLCFDGQCLTEAADCNDNGVPDCQEIVELPSIDCDGNGVPDECELPKSSGGLCTEGCAPDCDGNGVIDSCDIATCTPESEDYPACDDCNLNEVPDGCDVDPDDPDGNGHVSDDEDEDGVPDECVEAAGSGDWSGDIWDLSEQNPEFPYPDDGVGVADLSVTLDGTDLTIFADVDAEIHALRLINGASLDVTQTGEAGDLAIVASGLLEGNVLIKGTLTVGGDRTIEAAGRITIGVGGSYKPVIGLEDDVSATLKGDEITIDCGSVELGDTMNMEADGDLILQADDKGDCTPPDFETGDQSTTSVGGDFVIEDDANINYGSSEPLDLGGDFDNQSTDEENFNWDEGGVNMNGALHRFEAAGEDIGPWPAGLVMNFAVGTLTLAADTTARIVDTFDNQQDGEADCDEALYVDLLVVGPGSVLLTEGCHLYYNELLNEGSIPDLGKDVLQILEPCLADLNGNGIVSAADLAILLGNWGPCPGCPADFDGDNVVNAFDLAILLGNWGPCP